MQYVLTRVRVDGRIVRARRRVTHALHQLRDRVLLFGVQQFDVGVERGLRGQQNALGLDLLLAQRARDHVHLRRVVRILQHARDLVVAEAVRRLHGDRRFHAGAHLARRHGQQPVRIDLVRDADARRAGRHRRDAAQFETRQRAAVGHQLALALHHVHCEGCLAILERREFLRTGARDRRVARDDLLDQAAHRLDAQRQRDHVQQQPVVAGRAVAREEVRLDGGAQRDDLVRIDVRVRDRFKKVADGAADVRHARGTADEHDAVDVFHGHVRIAHRLSHGVHRLRDERLRDLGERLRGDRHLHDFARLQDRLDGRLFVRRQQFLGLARLDHQRRGVDFGQRREAGLLGDVAEQALVEVVAAERGIAARGQHFEHALRQLEDRDVERAAAQVVHGEHAFLAVVEAIRDGGGRRLGQQAQHVQAGQLRGVLRRLALRVVEVGRHRDDGADQFIAQRIFRRLAQRGQDLRGDFDRRLHAGHGLQLHHAGSVHKIVGQVLGVRDVLQAAAHEALDGDDGVLRIGGAGRHGLVADVGVAVREVAHDRWQQRAAVLVGQHFRDRVAHGRDEGIGGAQVDAHRQPVLVRRGRHAGFGDLQ